MCAHLSQISRFISAGHVCGVEEEVDWVVGGVVGWFILSCKLSHRPDSMQMGVRMGGAAPYGGGLFCFARSAERTAGASTAHTTFCGTQPYPPTERALCSSGA